MKNTNIHMKQVKDTVKLGVGSMAGLSAVGAMGNLPGMPTNQVASTTASAVNLANVGNLAKIGMNIIPKSKGKKWKFVHNQRVIAVIPLEQEAAELE